MFRQHQVAYTVFSSGESSSAPFSGKNTPATLYILHGFRIAPRCTSTFTFAPILILIIGIFFILSLIMRILRIKNLSNFIIVVARSIAFTPSEKISVIYTIE